MRQSLASPGLIPDILPSHDREVNFILSQCCFNLQNRVIIKLILILTKYSVFSSKLLLSPLKWKISEKRNRQHL